MPGSDVRDPRAALDAAKRTRRVPHLPAAIIGNGEMLATLSQRGEIEKLFWPHVDWGQHLGEIRLGLSSGGRTSWLDELPFEHRQRYHDDAAIVETVATCNDASATITDFVLPDDPVLVRVVEAGGDESRLVVYVRPEFEENPRYGGAYVDGATGALVFYRRATAIAVGVSSRSTARTGRIDDAEESAALADASRGVVAGDTVGYGVVDGAIAAAFSGEITLAIALGTSPAEALGRLSQAVATQTRHLLAARRRSDTERLASAAGASLGGAAATRLYRRSLQVFDLLTDRRSGGVIAAPEMDGDFRRSGGYGFVWGRDMAFSVLAFLAAGRDDSARRGLRWLARTQSPEGLWLHRHWTDGSLAPSWGLHQIDETGAALFAYEAGWRELHDDDLDEELWPSAARAADFLVGFREDNGLPRASVDLWEERYGQHAYSAAAVQAGLRAAAQIAARHESARARVYAVAAEETAAAIEREFWDERHSRYRRTPATPPPEANGHLRYPAEIRSTGNRRTGSLDPALDSSLLGLAWPFAAVQPSSTRMEATVAALRDKLEVAGGLRRYEGDDYAGGNAWILTTLWLGLWARQVGEHELHEESVQYALDHQTPVGLLPEQTAPDGTPAWVVPLTWSHAMFVLAVRPELALVRDVAGDRASRPNA